MHLDFTEKQKIRQGMREVSVLEWIQKASIYVFEEEQVFVLPDLQEHVFIG